MFSERTSILNQVAAGQMTADEAARLLGRPSAAASEHLKGRWLHVRVTRLSTGKSLVSVNLPLSWVEVGMKIGARYQGLAGVDWDEIVALVNSGADGRLVEVENLEDDERIEIFVE